MNASNNDDGEELDVFRAPDQETAFRVATIIRSFGHAGTEV
jgi:hypothetical protein